MKSDPFGFEALAQERPASSLQLAARRQAAALSATLLSRTKNFGQFVVANINPLILLARMELTNAILASDHAARRFGEASDWKTLMNSARANLPGIHIATFGYGGVQRSTGCVAAISCHRVGIRLGRPNRIIESQRRLDREFRGAA